MTLLGEQKSRRSTQTISCSGQICRLRVGELNFGRWIGSRLLKHKDSHSDMMVGVRSGVFHALLLRLVAWLPISSTMRDTWVRALSANHTKRNWAGPRCAYREPYHAKFEVCEAWTSPLPDTQMDAAEIEPPFEVLVMVLALILSIGCLAFLMACACIRGHATLRELLQRDMLTEADLSSGTFEVQRLRFALPKGDHAFGPSAHIKVRAPDAPGQRDRVRAYSALLEESAAGVAAEAARQDVEPAETPSVKSMASESSWSSEEELEWAALAQHQPPLSRDDTEWAQSLTPTEKTGGGPTPRPTPPSSPFSLLPTCPPPSSPRKGRRVEGTIGDARWGRQPRSLGGTEGRGSSGTEGEQSDGTQATPREIRLRHAKPCSSLEMSLHSSADLPVPVVDLTPSPSLDLRLPIVELTPSLRTFQHLDDFPPAHSHSRRPRHELHDDSPMPPHHHHSQSAPTSPRGRNEAPQPPPPPSRRSQTATWVYEGLPDAPRSMSIDWAGARRRLCGVKQLILAVDWQQLQQQGGGAAASPSASSASAPSSPFSPPPFSPMRIRRSELTIADARWRRPPRGGAHRPSAEEQEGMRNVRRRVEARRSLIHKQRERGWEGRSAARQAALLLRVERMHTYEAQYKHLQAQEAALGAEGSESMRRPA